MLERLARKYAEWMFGIDEELKQSNILCEAFEADIDIEKLTSRAEEIGAEMGWNY